MRVVANILKLFKDSLVAISLFVCCLLSLLGFSPSLKLTQIEPIYTLFVLFVLIKGLQESHFLEFLASKLEKGSFIAPKMVALSFFASIFLSIDVTLIALLPLILLMRLDDKKRLFILVAFTTHLGAALTPFGTPQNLFIFSFYPMTLTEFIATIAPFSLFLFLLFFILSFLIKEPLKLPPRDSIWDRRKAIFFLALLLFGIALSLKLLPSYLGVILLIIALWIDKNAFKVDYALLLTFILFISISNQIKTLLTPYLVEIKEPFFITILLSQIVSNVGATLLLHNFTNNANSLLLASNIGSFGTPVAALANLITYKIYYNATKDSSFLYTMTRYNLLALFIACLSSILYPQCPFP